MDKEEIIRRLKKISEYAVHVTGEPPFIMGFDDGIALNEAVTLLKEQEPIKPVISRSGQYFCGGCCGYLCSTGKESGVRHCNYCGRSVKWE